MTTRPRLHLASAALLLSLGTTGHAAAATSLATARHDSPTASVPAEPNPSTAAADSLSLFGALSLLGYAARRFRHRG